MQKIRVYVDTSVFGGTQDEEFAQPSNRFFELVHQEKIIVLLSTVTLREISLAPISVQTVLKCIPEKQIEEISLSPEIEELAQEYLNEKILSNTSINDALHIAAATIANADLILSWNFKHIVNFNRIRGYNNINTKQGYKIMTILCPLEIDDENYGEDL